MITDGWLVCSECEGAGWVGFGSFVIECPDCDGTGDPLPDTYDEDDEDSEGHIGPVGYDDEDSEDDDDELGHQGPVGYDAFDFADDR